MQNKLYDVYSLPLWLRGLIMSGVAVTGFLTFVMVYDQLYHHTTSPFGFICPSVVCVWFACRFTYMLDRLYRLKKDG